jgi:AcrR family transcriptional regulator
MSTTQRKYKLKARAERQRQTRERIVAATAALHREVGPARTTIADVARRAGVQRLTVYNTFPRLQDLLGACQAHFLAASPPPNIKPDALHGDVLDRLQQALTELYGWFRANESMERNVHRDRHLLPELDELLQRTVDPSFDAAALAYAKLIGQGKSVRPLVRLALEFGTWALLAGQGLTDREIAMLMRRAIAAFAQPISA